MEINGDAECTAYLDALDAVEVMSLQICDWGECRRLVVEALALLDRAGRPHVAAALHLAGALDALDGECLKIGLATTPVLSVPQACAFS